MAKKILEYTIVLLCAAMASYLKDNSGLKGIAAYLLPPFASVALYFVLMSLLNSSEAIWIFRYLLRKESRIEGEWIETVRKESRVYYSLFSIYYDTRTQNYHLTGVAITATGELHAKWNSTYLKYDHEQGKILYTFQSRLNGETDCPGYAELSFLKSSGQWKEGDGFFVDFKEKKQPAKISVRFQRVTSEQKRKYIGKSTRVLDEESRDEFIRNYHNQQVLSNQKNSPKKQDYEKIWGEVYGVDRDPVRRHLIYPHLLSKLGDLNNATVLDLGCGNGGFFKQIHSRRYSEAIGLDISDEFLKVADENESDGRNKFVKADLMQLIPIQSGFADCITSIFVLNELPSLSHFFFETSRLLKSDGTCHIILTHPALLLQSIIHEMATGAVLGKITGSLDYKATEELQYHFTLSSAVGPFYQHTFEELIDALNNADLSLLELDELRTDLAAFAVYDDYSRERLLPKYLYLKIKKKCN